MQRNERSLGEGSAGANKRRLAGAGFASDEDKLGWICGRSLQAGRLVAQGKSEAAKDGLCTDQYGHRSKRIGTTHLLIAVHNQLVDERCIRLVSDNSVDARKSP